MDACLGAAGHAVRILEATSPHGRVLGIDRDPRAMAVARERLHQYRDRTMFAQSDFRNLADVLAAAGIREISGILFDLGLSSMQLDDASRGFSYVSDGPLDMRADPSQHLTAEMIINDYAADQLADIFFTYGEERRSRQAAARIVEYRAHTRITGTRQLAELLRPALSRQHYFRSLARIWMALRIAVNDELSALAEGLSAGVSALAGGGRAVVLSYHSLEDRIVKTSFKEWSRRCTCSPALGACTCGANPLVKILTPRPVTAPADEIAENPRSRPAKLRAVEKLKPGNVQPVHDNLREKH